MNNKFSYTFHISNGKSSIKNKSTLTKCIRHNIRGYGNNDTSNIKVLVGSSNVEDVKKDFEEVYFRLFHSAIEEYNKNQKRKDRRILDYFDHVSNDNKTDIATEIIIQVGDKNNKPKLDFTNFYLGQIERFKKKCPNFEIVHASLHFDETTPHLHILGIPYGEYGRGLSKRVSKTKVFTKKTLEELQNNMREGYNFVNQNIKKGRNHDFSVAEYIRIQKNIEEKIRKETEKLLREQEDIKKQNEELFKKQNALKKQKLNLRNRVREIDNKLRVIDNKLRVIERNIETIEKNIKIEYSNSINRINKIECDFKSMYNDDKILERVFSDKSMVDMFKSQYEEIRDDISQETRNKLRKQKNNDIDNLMNIERKKIEEYKRQNGLYQNDVNYDL